MWAGPNGMLEVFTWDASSDAPAVAVLPNGYGMLSYAHTVCEVLADIGASVSAVNFSGQGQSDGDLSLSSMTSDCGAFLERVIAGSGGQPVTILAHCTAMLPLIELDRQSFSWDHFKQIILYGYLATPSEHFARFLRKGRRYGVRVGQELDTLPEFLPEDYAAISCDLVVIHPRIPNNLYRAMPGDLQGLIETARPRSVFVPDFGYAISQYPQITKVRAIVESFIVPLLESDITRRLVQNAIAATR